MPRTRRRRWPWIVAAVAIVLLIPVAIVVVPILTHADHGLSTQGPSTEEWPTSVSAAGDDGRSRSVSVVAEDGASVDTSSLVVGDRIVVSGSGFDGTQGIYVAICVIPDDPATRPGPCIGGVPDQEQAETTAGTVQFAPSNWINDDWAWKLFGARSYDDVTAGTFTAYLEIGDPAADDIDCLVDACGIVTRNDHTAIGDRVQDVFVPVRFAG